MEVNIDNTYYIVMMMMIMIMILAVKQLIFKLGPPDFAWKYI